MSTARGFDFRFMQELKQKNEIVEVIGSYVALDRKGNTHWACCPFHHERTPSFAVNQAEQFYHCFGCGVSGDVVKFVQEIESTDFIGSVRILAARAKMEVPESNFDTEEAVKRKKKRDAMSKIMLDCARFYLSNLYSGDERADAHLQYISNRKLAPTTVKKFGLGASLDFDSLPEYLAEKGYMKQDLLDSGALVEAKSGRLVDFQAGRLIFPIINAMDEVVAFGGRLLEKSDFAKYKNTKETMLFNKSKTLYNVNLLKKLKRKQAIPNVIMVEGYMDTISLYQAGFENVVASMGTALTKEQARLLKRYSDNVLISYDGDFAGQKADSRGIEILKDENINVRVVPMPDGLDPDDVVKQGADKYQACLDKAMPLVDYKLHALEKKYDIKDTEGRRRFVNEALKVVATADTESVKEELLKHLRDKTGISYHALERDLQAAAKESKNTETVETPQARITETAPGTDKQRKAI
ncbi:MAG: DNA primase, partial [Clostridia bacterium]|nr:DNA primase [Clostridia bacterium]